MPGWIAGTKKDVSDFEWTVLSAAFRKHCALIAGHVLISIAIKYFAPKVSSHTCYQYTLLTSSNLFCSYKQHFTLFMVSRQQPLF